MQANGTSKQYPSHWDDEIVRHPEKSGSGVANHTTVALEDRISALTTKDPAKLAVYLFGFDGHCLRAHSYFSENMPDIERAPEGAKCYKALVGEREIYFHEFEVIEYMGEQMTGADLVRRLSQ